MANCCNDYSRTQLLRRAAAEAGQGLPAIEPGMPLPAGTGLTRRSFVSRATGLALSVYGAASLGPKAFEQGIAAAAAQAPASDRILVSIFLSGGADSLTMLAPTTAHPQYARLAAHARAARRAGHAADRGPVAALAPVARGAGRALRRGQGHRDAGGRLRRRQPVALHLAALLGGRRDATRSAAGAGSAATSTSTARPTTRSRALRSAGTSSRCSPRATCRSPTVAEPDNYDFWTPGVWGPVQDKMLDAFGDLGEPATNDVGLAQARTAVAATGRLRDQLAPYQDGFTTPAGRDLPGRRLRAAAARARGDDRRRAAAEGRGDRVRRLRHALEPAGQPAGRPARDRRQPARVPARPRGAGRSRTACSCTCGASSAAGPRRTAPARTTARPARAS